MKLFKDLMYPDEKKEVLDIDVVTILTSNERASIEQGYYDEEFGRQKTRAFAINYAHRKGDRAPIVSGFQFQGKLYAINQGKREIIVQPAWGELFYDSDKVSAMRRFVFEGELEEFVAEFLKKEYVVIEG